MYREKFFSSKAARYRTSSKQADSNSGSSNALTDDGSEDGRVDFTNEDKRDTKIVVIAENRAREICVCMMRTSAMYSLEVQVLSDSHSYSETMAVVEAIEPNEILLHDGTRSSTLSQKLSRAAQQMQKQRPGIRTTMQYNNSSSIGSDRGSSSASASVNASGFRVLYINRQYFDQDRGADLLRRVCVRSIDSELVSKYIVLGACFCLLKYIESITGHAIAPHSLRINALGVVGPGGGSSDGESAGGLSAPHSNHMHMDRRTASNLEVTLNSRSGRQKESLFGAINYTRTVVGARLLRANLLRPITDIPTLNMRLDAVDALVAGTLATTDLSDILVKLPDLDKTLSGLATAGHLNRGDTAQSDAINKSTTTTTSSTNPRVVKLAIDTLICIKHSIQQGGQLADAIHRITNANVGSFGINATSTNPYTAGNNSSSASSSSNGKGSSAEATLLSCIESNLRHPSLSTILDAITALLTEGVAYSRASHEMRHQECFAVRQGVHTFLDVSRGAFLQAVGDIHDKAGQYAEELNAEVRVAFSSSRGYFLQVHLASDRDATAVLPRTFIQAVQNRRVVSCTTNELLSLSSRALEAIETALRITNDLVQDLLTSIRGYSDILFVFVDSIALLDMLQSFAELVHSCPHVMTRPRLVQGGALVIKEGRHPIMSLLGHRYGSSRAAGNIVRDGLPFVPNDTYISDTEAFQIVTGGNGAGKSTYIKQVALLCILAQVGCYVPASYMLLPVRSRLLSRIGTGDDMEHNMSTFHTEMRECGYILDMADRTCLVIIDELGRGTANAEGLSIAMAVAEALITSGAMTLFVTHFAQLTSLEEVYPAAVCNVHLGGSALNADTSEARRSSSSSAVLVEGGLLGEDGSNSGKRIDENESACTHRMCTGPSPLRSGYGLMAAQRCGMPTEVLEAANAMHRRIKQLHPLILDISAAQRDVAALQSLLGSLSVLRSSTLDNAGIRFYLSTLAQKLTDSERQGLIQALDSLTIGNQTSCSRTLAAIVCDPINESDCKIATGEVNTIVFSADKENLSPRNDYQSINSINAVSSYDKDGDININGRTNKRPRTAISATSEPSHAVTIA